MNQKTHHIEDPQSVTNKNYLPIVTRISINLIRLYQFLLSPDHGILFPHRVRTCRFYPSCSEFTIRALHAHGFFIGLRYSIKRVCRCHPWQEGGYNPVPDKPPRT